MACDGHIGPTRRASAGCDYPTLAARSRRGSTIRISCRAPGSARGARAGHAVRAATAARPAAHRWPAPVRANAAGKVVALVAGMVAGADSISDMDLLRHGGMTRLFDGVRAPSTLGHVPAPVHLRPRPPTRRRRRPAADRAGPGDPDPARRGAGERSSTSTTPCARPTATPSRAPDAATPASTASTPCSPSLSTPLSVPVIAAARLRKGSTNSVRGAASLLTEALATARRAGAATARHACCWCGRTRRSTATTSSMPAAEPGPGSPSPPG